MHARLVNSKIEKNIYIWNSLITMYTKCGAPNNAISVWEDMCKSGVQPGLCTHYLHSYPLFSSSHSLLSSCLCVLVLVCVCVSEECVCVCVYVCVCVCVFVCCLCGVLFVCLT